MSTDSEKTGDGVTGACYKKTRSAASFETNMQNSLPSSFNENPTGRKITLNRDGSPEKEITTDKQ